MSWLRGSSCGHVSLITDLITEMPTIVCDLQKLLHHSQKRSAEMDAKCKMQNAKSYCTKSKFTNTLYIESESHMLRSMMYNEFLVRIEDQSCVISEARMTVSFHHLLIGVEQMIVSTAFSTCRVSDEKCPLVERKATREQSSALVRYIRALPDQVC